jgi:hypothetical protein
MAGPNDMQKFIADLMDNHIPSIGPETGKFLLRIIEALDAIPNPSEHILWYKTALQTITRVAALHQAAVICGLEELVGKRKK